MKITKLLAIGACAAFAVTVIALPEARAHEGHDHGASPSPNANAPAGDAWTNAQAAFKAMQAAATAKQDTAIHSEQEKLVAALKQMQEKGGGADKARLEGAIKNAIAASEKVHAAADAKDFAKVDASMKTLETTMSMVEKHAAAPAK